MGTLSDMLREAAEIKPASRSSSLSEIMVEEPVPLSVFIQDRKYLGNPPLSLEQYEAVRHAERVYYPDLYPQLGELNPYWAQPCRMVNFITLEWGKGGGKDHICRITSLRIAYLLLCLRSPQDYYEMPEQDTIHLLNVASSSGQASRAFFTPMTRAVTRGWFADRAEPLMNIIRFDKNVEAISGHSDAESQEGLNLMLGIADEIDAFRSKEELEKYRGIQARESTRSAEGILDMIRTSAKTRFPEVFKNVRISYPRYLGSMIQRLIKQGELSIAKFGDDSPHYVSGPKATWEVNPRVPGRHSFKDDYDEDPVLARAKYECLPSRAINPYFTNEIAVEAAMDEVDHPRLEIQYTKGDAGVAWAPDYIFSPDLIPIRGAIYSMHADLAISGDRAGIALAHVSSHTEVTVVGQDETGGDVEVRETRPVVKVDFVASFSADASQRPPREIQVRWARMLCLELRRRGFNIVRFTFDGFQSIDSMQILETHGIESKRVSTDLSEEPWRILRDLFSEVRVRIPSFSVVDEAGVAQRPRVFNEILGLSRRPNGKIDHLAGASKDEADALACAVMGAVELGGQESEDGEEAYPGQEEFTIGSPLPLPDGFMPLYRIRPDEVARMPVDLDTVTFGPDHWWEEDAVIHQQ